MRVFVSMNFFLIVFLSFLSWKEIYGDELDKNSERESPLSRNAIIQEFSGADAPTEYDPAADAATEEEPAEDAATGENEIIVDSKKPYSVSAADSSAPNKRLEEIQMLRGDLQTIKVHSLTRVSVSNPEVADFSSVESDQIILLAKKAGQTEVFLWDEHGKRTISIRVLDEDLLSLKSRLEAFLKTTHIEGVTFIVSAYEGKLIAIGDLPKDKKEQFVKMIAPFTNSVRDLVKEEVVEDLVQIDVQIAEVSASFSKTLGLEWNNALTYNETNFSAAVARDIFKVSPLSRVTQISAKLNALITEGKGRILSKPKLVVISGKEASFQVGGQIPISTTTTSAGGNVQQNVEFKDYGIGLTITPTIKNNKVDVKMQVNVSDIDLDNRVGTNVAFTTRRAQTQLFLEDGQSVVLAGLIKHNEGQTVTKVPFLGDIPLVGLVFRNKTTGPNKDTELVITLTPTIIRQNQKKAEVPSASAQEAAAKPSGQEKQKEAETSKEVKPESESPQSTDKVLESKDKPSAAPAPTTDDLIAAYMKSIQGKIFKSINYPFEAKEKGWTGVVKLSLHILKDGSLADVSVKESSGYSIFDKDATNTAQISAPYDPFPESLKLEELVVTAPIVYGPESLLKAKAPAAREDSLSKVPEPSTPAEIAFARAVQQRIADAIEYPDEAREVGWEGTVKISLLILSDGTLASCVVKESSGHDAFDEAAVKIVKELAPYNGFPSEPDLQELKITVPIVFNIEQEQ